MHLMFQPFLKFVDFSGRANRTEYWLFLLLTLLLGFVGGMIGDVVPLFIMLALLLPTAALGVRRLHDINLSGWFYVINFIPLAGAVFMIIVGLIPGDTGENKFGSPPE
jgi:uncharacterized membrane protein YhaH (DUF805 family)